MSYNLFGEATGRMTHRRVYWVTPATMAGPYKYWGIKIVDTVLRGPHGGKVREKRKTCRTLEEAQRHIKARLEHVP